jgi:hypothetical protein
MPNLFTALRDSNAETLAMQLALLESVTTSNALRPSAQRLLKWGAAAINRASSLMKRKSSLVKEPLVVELKDRVRDRFTAYKSDQSDRLLVRVREECRRRLGSPATDSDTCVSVKLIDEAAAHYEIDEWLTPAEKAEAISRRYQEESLANLRKIVAKMSPSERANLEKQISQELASLPHEQRETIQRDLKLDRLSGEALTRALLGAGGPLASMATLSATGFGAYLALTTIIHAVATTALGITLPFAVYTSATSALSLLTGPVGWVIAGLTLIVTWHFSERKLSRHVFAGLVTVASGNFPASSSFPSPSAPLDSSEMDEAAATANALEERKREAKVGTDSSLKKLEQENERLDKTEAARQKAVRAAENARTRLASTTPSKVEDVRRLEATVAEAEAMAFAEIEKAEVLKVKIGELASEKERLEKALEQAQIHQVSFEDGEAKRLLELWAIHFPKMAFDRQPARWVVHKNHRERISLEKKLAELHGSEDPAALSRGKMRASGDHHLMFRLENVECRMFYRIKGNQITITELGTNQQTH